MGITTWLYFGEFRAKIEFTVNNTLLLWNKIKCIMYDRIVYLVCAYTTFTYKLWWIMFKHSSQSQEQTRELILGCLSTAQHTEWALIGLCFCAICDTLWLKESNSNPEQTTTVKHPQKGSDVARWCWHQNNPSLFQWKLHSDYV